MHTVSETRQPGAIGMSVRLLLTPLMIIGYNGVIFAMSTLAAYGVISLLLTPQNEFAQIMEILDGVSVIYIGYGVLMEERESIFSTLRVYPRHETPREHKINSICHGYGVGYLVLGLLMEILTYGLRMPTWLLDSRGRETPVLYLGVAMVLIVVLMLMLHVVDIVRLLARGETAKA